MFPILSADIYQYLDHKITVAASLPVVTREQARHPAYVSPWERAERRPTLGPITVSGTIGVARLEQIDPEYVARGIAAWEEGRRRDAIVILRDGFINGGEEAPDGRFTLVFALMFDGQTEETYRWASTGIDPNANDLMLLTLATLLAERGETTPQHVAFTRARFLGLNPSRFDELAGYLLPTDRPNYARATAWSALARRFAGNGMTAWGQLATQRVLALDPGNPIAADRLAAYALSKPITPEAKRDLATTLKLALARAKPGYLAQNLWSLLYRADMDAARAIPRPRRVAPAKGS